MMMIQKTLPLMSKTLRKAVLRPTLVPINFVSNTTQSSAAAQSNVTKSKSIEVGAADLHSIDISKSSPSATNSTISTSSGITTSDITNRFGVTMEVAVSKIFPAGFGWQLGSVIAGNMGCAPVDTLFFAMTGLGDAAFVLGGHYLFKLLKKHFVSPSIDPKQELHTGLLLGSAAFFSGSAWQPLVNALEASQTLPWVGVAVGSTVGCGLAYFGGLRLFRGVYNKAGLMVDDRNDKNLIADIQLSASIGGAAGGFVGTDVAYLDAIGNPLKDIVGVYPTDSVPVGLTKAGVSTSIGFVAIQSAQNIASSKGKNWTD